MNITTSNKKIEWIDSVDMEEATRVGGKNASLGEMVQALDHEIQIPPGFIVTVDCYQNFLSNNDLISPLQEVFEKKRKGEITLEETGVRARDLIRGGAFSEESEAAIQKAYKELCDKCGSRDVDVAVRSSATAEDLPEASFAGQQETFLNVRGPHHLLAAITECYSSLYTDRAISYRDQHGFPQLDVSLSVGVQKMVRSDLGASGVAFTLDTESGFEDIILINATWGLGETIVQGTVTPDEYLVFKPELDRGTSAIIEKIIGNKHLKMVYGAGGSETRIEPVSNQKQREYVLKDKTIVELARQAQKIEEYYSEKYDRWCPMDIEWAYDGEDEKLYIVQARPETVHSNKQKNKLHVHSISEPEESRADQLLVEGIAIGDQIANSSVTVLNSLSETNRFQEGDVLVTPMTDPDWEPIMNKASAIVTNRGGRTCHAAIVAREMGKPSVVGTGDGTNKLRSADNATVCCAEGQTGRVYQGPIKYDENTVKLSDLPDTSTDVMINLANPDEAFKFSQLPVGGVGLAREEFIINSYIGIHPLALLNYQEIKNEDALLAAKIAEKTHGYEDKQEFFVDKLCQGLTKIAAAFYPRPVIVRFSDFKSNEYANLLGGPLFEPDEQNPMIGWRGASRYYSDKYRDAFHLECEGIRRVREEKGMDNLHVMVPFCRTIEEGKKVLATMDEFGLDPDDLQVYVMAELPANIVLADQFAELFDGFSIGSNDLTQLVLGLDRDSAEVSHIYDERDDAVKNMISTLIQKAKRNERKVSICGQAPSDFPDFASFLVDEGIDVISCTPDSVLQIKNTIAEAEQSH